MALTPTEQNSHPDNYQPDLGMFGGVALKESTDTPTARVIEIDGQSYITNVPSDIDLFMSPEDGMSSLIGFKIGVYPLRLDELPDGEFFVNGSSRETTPISKSFTTYETDNGKVVTTGGSFIYGWGNNFGYLSDHIREGLGFVVQTNPEYTEQYSSGAVDLAGVTAFPTPNTLKKMAAALGVTVRYVADQGHIEDETYLKAYSDGEYPASTHEMRFYFHDIGDDHLLSMVVGGNSLRDVLKRAAAKALATGDKKVIGACVHDIDIFTGIYFPDAIHQKMRFDDYYGTPEFNSACRRADLLGISRKDLKRMIESAEQGLGKLLK